MIRHATENDLAVIVEIYNASIPSRLATADLEPVTVDSRRAWLAEHSADHYPLWVYEAGSMKLMVAGWVSFGPVYRRPAWDSTAEVSVYVAPQFHRRGVGSALLEEAIVHAPALGLRALLGFIFGNNGPSLALFHKFGFDDWGRLPSVCELDGVRRDVVIVGRHIG